MAFGGCSNDDEMIGTKDEETILLMRNMMIRNEIRVGLPYPSYHLCLKE